MTDEHSSRAQRAALWALFAGNFAIGTGVLLPAGMLNDLAAGLGLTPSRAGLLLFVGGIVIGLGAPVFASLTNRFGRRGLLVASLALYVVGHALSAVVSGFTELLIIRALTIVAAGIFTPQAAACVGLLVPPERRAQSVAFIFIGWSIASVAGVPLGSLVSAALGWRIAYAIMALLSLIAMLLVWRFIPKGLRIEPLSLSAWRDVFTRPAQICVLLVTLASASGQFTLFSYMAPLFKDTLGAAPTLIAALLAVLGIAGVAGNLLAVRVVGRFGIDRTILLSFIAMLTGIVLFGLTAGITIAAAVSVGIWGLGTFSSNSLQQSRLIALAPSLASASVALNTSVIYLGQAVGAGAGGRLIAAGDYRYLAWVGAFFVALAIILSLTAERLSRRA
ncbi:MFS transporter [soil metagenome]